MQEAELQKSILTRLERGANRDDLLLDVCKEANLSWPEAEALVNQIEAGHTTEIARHQSPFIIILSLGGLVIGLGWGFMASLGVFDILRSLLPNPHMNPSMWEGIGSTLIALRVYLPSILISLGLCIGGMTGLLSSLSAWKSR